MPTKTKNLSSGMTSSLVFSPTQSPRPLQSPNVSPKPSPPARKSPSPNSKLIYQNKSIVN